MLDFHAEDRRDSRVEIFRHSFPPYAPQYKFYSSVQEAHGATSALPAEEELIGHDIPWTRSVVGVQASPSEVKAKIRFHPSTV